MKKTYFAPECEAIELQLQSLICVSGGTNAGDDPEERQTGGTDWDNFD